MQGVFGLNQTCGKYKLEGGVTCAMGAITDRNDWKTEDTECLLCRARKAFCEMQSVGPAGRREWYRFAKRYVKSTSCTVHDFVL